MFLACMVGFLHSLWMPIECNIVYLAVLRREPDTSSVGIHVALHGLVRAECHVESRTTSCVRSLVWNSTDGKGQQNSAGTTHYF